MRLYKKKPDVIEAFLWTGGVHQIRDQVWICDAMRRGEVFFISPVVLVIKTPEGTMVAKRGDWIIRGVKGEIYPCKPDIFAATYEAVI